MHRAAWYPDNRNASLDKNFAYTPLYLYDYNTTPKATRTLKIKNFFKKTYLKLKINNFNLYISHIFMVTEVGGLILYSSSRSYEVQILIIKLLWCGHLARTRWTCCPFIANCLQQRFAIAILHIKYSLMVRYEYS